MTAGLVGEPMRYVVNHCANGAGCKSCPHHAQQQHRVRALQGVDVDMMGHECTAALVGAANLMMYPVGLQRCDGKAGLRPMRGSTARLCGRYAGPFRFDRKALKRHGSERDALQMTRSTV